MDAGSLLRVRSSLRTTQELKDIRSCLRGYAVFSDWSDDALLQLAGVLGYAGLSSEEQLAEEGVAVGNIYILLAGSCDVSVPHPTDPRVTSRHQALRPGDACGLEAILFEDPRARASVTAGPQGAQLAVISGSAWRGICARAAAAAAPTAVTATAAAMEASAGTPKPTSDSSEVEAPARAAATVGKATASGSTMGAIPLAGSAGPGAAGGYPPAASGAAVWVDVHVNLLCLFMKQLVAAAPPPTSTSRTQHHHHHKHPHQQHHSHRQHHGYPDGDADGPAEALRLDLLAALLGCLPSTMAAMPHSMLREAARGSFVHTVRPYGVLYRARTLANSYMLLLSGELQIRAQRLPDGAVSGFRAPTATGLLPLPAASTAEAVSVETPGSPEPMVTVPDEAGPSRDPPGLDGGSGGRDITTARGHSPHHRRHPRKPNDSSPGQREHSSGSEADSEGEESWAEGDEGEGLEEGVSGVGPASSGAEKISEEELQHHLDKQLGPVVGTQTRGSVLCEPSLTAIITTAAGRGANYGRKASLLRTSVAAGPSPATVIVIPLAALRRGYDAARTALVAGRSAALLGSVEPLRRCLSATQLADLALAARPVVLAAGAVLARQGAPVDALYIVQEGEIRLLDDPEAAAQQQHSSRNHLQTQQQHHHQHQQRHKEQPEAAAPAAAAVAKRGAGAGWACSSADLATLVADPVLSSEMALQAVWGGPGQHGLGQGLGHGLLHRLQAATAMVYATAAAASGPAPMEGSASQVQRSLAHLPALMVVGPGGLLGESVLGVGAPAAAAAAGGAAAGSRPAPGAVAGGAGDVPREGPEDDDKRPGRSAEGAAAGVSHSVIHFPPIGTTTSLPQQHPAHPQSETQTQPQLRLQEAPPVPSPRGQLQVLVPSPPSTAQPAAVGAARSPLKQLRSGSPVGSPRRSASSLAGTPTTATAPASSTTSAQTAEPTKAPLVVPAAGSGPAMATSLEAKDVAAEASARSEAETAGGGEGGRARNHHNHHHHHRHHSQQNLQSRHQSHLLLQSRHSRPAAPQACTSSAQRGQSASGAADIRTRAHGEEHGVETGGGGGAGNQHSAAAAQGVTADPLADGTGADADADDSEEAEQGGGAGPRPPLGATFSVTAVAAGPARLLALPLEALLKLVAQLQPSLADLALQQQEVLQARRRDVQDSRSRLQASAADGGEGVPTRPSSTRGLCLTLCYSERCVVLMVITKCLLVIHRDTAM